MSQVDGKYNSSGVFLEDGQRTDLQVDFNGSLRVNIVGDEVGLSNPSSSLGYYAQDPYTVGGGDNYESKAFLIACTVAGTVTIQLQSGAPFTIPTTVGTTILPLNVSNVTASTGTATYFCLN